MKIGILTYCNSYNYGAYLQAYNLCSKLNTYENIEAELIDYSMRQELEIYKVRIHKNPLVTYEKYMKKKAFTKAKKDLCLRLIIQIYQMVNNMIMDSYKINLIISNKNIN